MPPNQAADGSTQAVPQPNAESLKERWRLMLGPDAGRNLSLSNDDAAAMDKALTDLYGGSGKGSAPGSNPGDGLDGDDGEDGDEGEETGNGDGKKPGKGGLQGSAPRVARWLGDIREYFPSSVVQVMQKDAMDRLGLQQMLLEPELLESVQPDVNLVTTLLSLKNVMPDKTKDSARLVVRKVVEELEKRLVHPMRQAISGSLNRATRKFRPKHNEIDWLRTIRANLRHYQPDYQSIIPEHLIGFSRKSQSLLDVILLLDESASMVPSVIYASIFAAVMASIRAITTKVIAFDTEVADLTTLCQDPVDLLFGTQLGGGTDIAKALSYALGLVTRPKDTICVLISDLCEGGSSKNLLALANGMVQSGIQMIALLALDDQGAPAFDHEIATRFVEMGIPCFACTPDQFPDLMGAAIKRQDLTQWAAKEGIIIHA